MLRGAGCHLERGLFADDVAEHVVSFGTAGCGAAGADEQLSCAIVDLPYVMLLPGHATPSERCGFREDVAGEAVMDEDVSQGHERFRARDLVDSNDVGVSHLFADHFVVAADNVALPDVAAPLPVVRGVVPKYGANVPLVCFRLVGPRNVVVVVRGC